MQISSVRIPDLIDLFIVLIFNFNVHEADFDSPAVGSNYSLISPLRRHRF